jgi:hypothetical protein
MIPIILGILIFIIVNWPSLVNDGWDTDGCYCWHKLIKNHWLHILKEPNYSNYILHCYNARCKCIYGNFRTLQEAKEFAENITHEE